MANNRILVSCLLLPAFLSGAAGFSVSAFAEPAPFVTAQPPEPGQPGQALDQAPPPPIAAPAAAASSASDGPLTVTDVIIDKTDKNAVVARDQAIIEAQRTAFEVAAEKSMSPEAFKAYKVPDNKTIATLVDSFEIKNEQIAGNRYVASFTVRFLPEISNYIRIPDGVRVIAAAPPVAAPATTSATTAAAPAAASASASATAAIPAAPAAAAAAVAAASTTPRTVLILPYYEDASGKKALWDDPNPWRDAWQEVGSSAPNPNLTISVPTGDLSDVSSGDTDTVWKGDYSTIEKSRAKYNATEVALVVAHAGKGVELYIYKDGKLEREKSVGGKYNDQDSYKKAIAKMIAVLKAPVPYGAAKTVAAAAPVEEKTAEEKIAEMPPVEQAPASPAAEPPAAEEGKVTIEATMNFSNYAQWMEAQKRLASLSPPVDIEISGLSKDQAQFTLDYEAGGMAALRAALAVKGLMLDKPVIEVDESVLGSAAPTKKAVYELKLQN
jgi:hypothetical protein